VTRIGGVVASACSTLLGCADSRPSTSQLSARMEVEIGDRVIDISIQLLDLTDESVPTWYLIEPDEHVLVSYRDTVVDLLAGEVYHGRIGITDVVGGDEVIALTLDRGSAGTTTVIATTPPPLTINVPATVRASDEVLVTWSPTSFDHMEWYSSPWSFGPVRDDPGMLAIPPGVVAPVALEYEYDVMLTLVRERSATLASDLKYADVSVTRFHSATFTVTP
jgi:hypothetical protein